MEGKVLCVQHILIIILQKQFWKKKSYIIPNLQMKKLRIRVVMYLVQGQSVVEKYS